MKKIGTCRWVLPLLALALLTACERAGWETGFERFAWEHSTPGEQGLDPARIRAALDHAREAGFVDSMLVVRNGRIVAEAYHNGYSESRPHDVRSVSKSFLSALVGIALWRGYVPGLEAGVLGYFPEYSHPGLDPRLGLLAIRHLLTMRHGIPGEAENGYGVYWELYNSENWVRATLETPLLSAPGERMRYNTFSTHLLSAILAKTAGKSTREFASEALCAPMGIDIDGWEEDPQGIHFGGNAMQFTPREMAVLGLLYLRGGLLDGLQVVPREWVALTLSPSTSQPRPNAWGALKNYDYAYLWWLGELGGEKVFMALGYGGQYIVSFPALDLIIVATAPAEVDPNTAGDHELAILDIMAEHIVPAVTAGGDGA